MIKIGILPYSSAYCHNKLFDLNSFLNRDNSLQVWHNFRKRCLSLGWDVRTFNSKSDSFDVYLILDLTPQKLSMLGKSRLEKSITQFFEPPDVRPEQYGSDNLNAISQKIAIALCYNKSLCSKYGFMHHPWYTDLYPQREKMITPAKKRKSICMIATNKYNRHPLSKLNFRLDFVKNLTKNQEFITGFNLYGQYWTKAIGITRKLIPNLIANKVKILDKILMRFEKKIAWNLRLKKVYRGVMHSKNDILSKAKFNIIIENMFWDGYITEKIFDALQFGCIPIYFGADDISDYLPSSIFINGKLFSEPSDSIKYALSLTEHKVNNMIQAGQDWLHSVDFKKKFGRPSYIRNIQKLILQIVE